jgi:putative aldouronate transport system substrate-binding protein
MKTARLFITGILLTVFAGLTGCSKKEVAAVPGAEPVHVINVVTIVQINKEMAEVEAAINAIIEPLINTRVTYTGIDFGSYNNQVTMMMAAQEKMDLVLTRPVGATHFNIMAAQNQLMDITDLLNEYAPEMVREMNNVLPGIFEGTTINKRIMGVSGFYNKVLSDYIIMRKDILEKHGIEVSGIKTLDDYEPVLEKIRRLEPTMAPVVQANNDGVILSMESGNFYDVFSDPVEFDLLGDTQNRLGVVFMRNPDEVVNFYKTEDYLKNLQRVHRWYNNGWIYKDAAISTSDRAEDLVKGNKGFSWITASELGVEAAKTGMTGYPITAIKMTSGLITTSSLRKVARIVPSFSKEGPAAIKFLNLMNTREDLSNLMAWGIEGRDWEVKSDGTAGFPAGINVSNVLFHNVDYFAGNQFLTRVWEGNDPRLRELAKAENQSAPKSPLLGFSFDPVPIQNEISAITNIIAQYRPALESGSVDPAVELPKFIKAMDAAGAEKVINEMQRQLNAWKAAN